MGSSLSKRTHRLGRGGCRGVLLGRGRATNDLLDRRSGADGVCDILMYFFGIALIWFVAWIAIGAMLAGNEGAVVGFFLAYLTGFTLKLK